jgi:hypothetical protein
VEDSRPRRGDHLGGAGYRSVRKRLDSDRAILAQAVIVVTALDSTFWSISAPDTVLGRVGSDFPDMSGSRLDELEVPDSVTWAVILRPQHDVSAGTIPPGDVEVQRIVVSRNDVMPSVGARSGRVLRLPEPPLRAVTARGAVGNLDEVTALASLVGAVRPPVKSTTSAS